MFWQINTVAMQCTIKPHGMTVRSSYNNVPAIYTLNNKGSCGTFWTFNWNRHIDVSHSHIMAYICWCISTVWWDCIAIMRLQARPPIDHRAPKWVTSHRFRFCLCCPTMIHWWENVKWTDYPYQCRLSGRLALWIQLHSARRQKEKLLSRAPYLHTNISAVKN